MSDYDIGRGSEHNKDAHRDHNFPNRPNGGFIEERLTKLEYNQDEIKYAFGEATVCRACKYALMPPIQGTIQIPICQDCFENLGGITKKKKSWIFR